MHARGKSDEEFKAVADSGGVIGIVTVPFFLAPPPTAGKKITIESMFDHIDYVANLVGWEHVAIGTDWPMAMSKTFLMERFLPWAYKAGFRKEDRVDEMRDNLVGFDDYRDFPNITRGLVKRGYSDEQIKGILGENFLRVFKEICG
jgi:membrane dipeptidase